MYPRIYCAVKLIHTIYLLEPFIMEIRYLYRSAISLKLGLESILSEISVVYLIYGCICHREGQKNRHKGPDGLQSKSSP